MPAAPSLVTVHDVFAFTQPHPERVARWREQRPIRRVAESAARIVTGSRWSRDPRSCASCGVPAERIDVVNPSPDPFWFPALGDVLPAALAGRRFALLVGVRERRKNARVALEACARALRGPDEVLVVAANSSRATAPSRERSQLRCGEVAASDALLRALYRNASAVLVPSLAEGFGLVPIEAMACGAPSIASNATALPEATGGSRCCSIRATCSSGRARFANCFDDEAPLGASRGCRRPLRLLRPHVSRRARPSRSAHVSAGLDRARAQAAARDLARRASRRSL
jgi:glycosyltransferase involved in cell wall biosynthesis